MPISVPIIVSRSGPAVSSRSSARLPLWCAAAVAIWGIGAALVYAHEGLTLSHYDAKGHLVVARRVFDSLTPTWRQIGAVWLPLPHLLNLLPVQIDVFYRTGASAVAISILSLAAGAAAAARLVLNRTGSTPAALLAVALLATNPNLLYLQSTPMTEPLLIALLLVSTLCLERWATEGTDTWLRRSGWAIAGAVLTRYEAWPFTAAALPIALAARWRGGAPVRDLVGPAVRLACYPAVAVMLFLINSRLSTGVWFVTDGFYVPDPALQHKIAAVTAGVAWGARQLGSAVIAYGGFACAAILAIAALRSRDRAPMLVPLALLAVAALPWYAFYEGHPFRIRYMIPLLAASIVCLALVIGLLPRRIQAVAALAVLAVGVFEARPFDPRAAMVVEAQWDVPDSHGRQQVTACLGERRPGEVVLASMGSLAHYMQELSGAGYGIRDFLHEGNGELWNSALRNPRKYVSRMLVEEKAEGGDVLAARAAQDPAFLAGFTRVCAGGGVALYRINGQE